MSRVCKKCDGPRQTCQSKPAGTVCRAAFTECDLPEFCAGDSEFCPEDVTKKDGEPCRQGRVSNVTVNNVVCIPAASYNRSYSVRTKHH